MSLQFDPATGKITYQGREVGEHLYAGDKSIVRLCIEYKSPPDDWLVPLSYLAVGLSLLPENQPPTASLSIETAEDSIEKEFDVPRLLTEKIVKRSGYVWKFNKTDADPWPSVLHGHDYDRGLKLDAITGNIYDVGSRQCCKMLKSKDLAQVQDELRQSRDFAAKVELFIDKKES